MDEHGLAWTSLDEQGVAWIDLPEPKLNSKAGQQQSATDRP